MHYAPMHSRIGSQKDLTRTDMIFEPKLDGYRALCFVNKKLHFISRRGNDLTEEYPELMDIRKNIKAQKCILDGEIVAFDGTGNPHFNLLQQGAPAHYVVYDILMLEGKSLLHLPLVERKKILNKVIRDGGRLEKMLFTDDGKALWRVVMQRKLEGIMAKEKKSTYLSGTRSRMWLKIKRIETLDCVIVGYTTERRKVSSLALGVYKKGKLQYCGKVGTGFNENDIEQLSRLLKQKKIEKNPTNTIVKDTIHWVKPQLVAEITYKEITPSGKLRAPVYVRLRTDKKPKECSV